ncbi:MAG: Mfa1 fimbrilin C-terminal domain-containing protein [Alistipes sp.]|nr:Mfa1 fimbrilin C-terminal domain-containing protein [Alistipes sp.]
MKKYLFIALAALGFAACAEKDEMGNQPINNGEKEQSYVAVTFTADGVTRADKDYDEGLGEERAVHEAVVFFFKNGAPFYVKYDDRNNTSTNEGSYNYLKIKLQDNDPASNTPNVSDIKDEVLVLENYKGQYPNQMLAILNWSPKKSSYTLSELQSEISALGSDSKGYVMSNAVYADAAKDAVKTVIDAVKITEANISTDKDTALKNPVNIYVERIAAKVSFSAEKEGIFPIGEQVSNAEGGDDVMGDAPVDVYARIEGFQLYNDFEDSHLLKHIDPTWGGDSFGFTNWNDPDYHRSYWAMSQTKDFPNNTFNWNNNYTALDAKKPFVYCGENTQADKHTKVIVKATLVKKVGGNYESLEVVNWYGKNYIGEKQLKIVVANTLKHTYFTFDSATSKYIGIAPEDLKCVARKAPEKNAYEVYFQLSDGAVGKDWYKFDEFKSDYEKYSTSAVLDGELKVNVQPALVYKSGQTYYYTDIKHLGLPNSTTEFGVVRNHVYKVNITDIKGFGTPVYDPTIDIITPETPKDMKTFVSAQINILSWRIVEEDYQLGEDY